MADKAGKRVWFEKCNCSKTSGSPHGYFCSEEGGKFPIPTFSIQAGNAFTKVYKDKWGGLSDEEREKLRGQMRAAGLAGELTDADLEVIEVAVDGVKKALLAVTILDALGPDLLGN
jgi:hypothetical protein